MPATIRRKTTARLLRWRRGGPFPVSHFGQVLPVFADVLPVLDQFVLQLLLEVDSFSAGLRQPIDHIHHEMEPIQLVQDRHVEGRRNRALFLVAADMDVVVIRAPISQAVNEPGISVEGENDVFVLRKEFVEIHIAQTVRMLGPRLQLH